MAWTRWRRVAGTFAASALFAASAAVFYRAARIYGGRPGPPARSRAPAAPATPWEAFPTPPDTERFFAVTRPDAFQAVYESRLSRAAVLAFYRDWLAERGWREEAAPPVSGEGTEPWRRFSRGWDEAWFSFFPPEPPERGGCDFRIGAVRGRTADRAPSVPPPPASAGAP